MEEWIVEYLKSNNLKITTAESCTGGMISSRLISVSGASMVFEQGYITYSNEAKQKLINVNQETIKRYNVVSVEVAKEMAYGAMEVSGADVAVSVTGIAGPGGGTKDIPVGTVCIGVCNKDRCIVKKYNLEGDRQKIRELACDKAFELLKELFI